MIKKFIFPIAILGLVACGQKPELQVKKERLKEVKADIKSLSSELETLQAYVLKNDPAAQEQKNEAIVVATKKLEPEIFEFFFNTEGIVESELDVLVSPQLQGQITNILVSEGQWVKRGQILARQNTSVQNNQIKELKTRLELATTVFEKQSRLWKEKNIGSELQYLQAKSNKDALQENIAAVAAQMALANITSPVNGIVDKIFYKNGAYGTPQQPFAEVVNLKNLKVSANVSESYLSKLKVGDVVQVNFDDLSIEIDAPISRLGNLINPQSRTFEMDVEIDNIDNQIKPNALAKLRLKEYTNEAALVLPSNVIQQDNKGSFVFVVDNNNGTPVAQKKYITIGKTNNENQTMVTGGLTEGEQVIVEGFNLVNNGLQVKIVE